MNYKDFLNIKYPSFSPIMLTQNLQDKNKMIFIYTFIENNGKYDAICSNENFGIKEIYNVKSTNDKDYLFLNNSETPIADLSDSIILLEQVGEIKEDKIFSEYFNQGYFYKNGLNFLKTLHLTDDEIDKLPITEKVCYIPESFFHDKDYIDLNENQLLDGDDYYTVKTFKEAIINYYGSNIMKKISDKDKDEMLEQLFKGVDWQCPESLLDADQYLDGYVEEILDIELDSGYGK